MAFRSSETASELADRGIAWQAFGFAIVGLVVLALMRVYSDSDDWRYDLFIVTVTQLYWAFALLVGFAIDRSRKLFETRAQIREQLIRNTFRKGLTKGQREENKRVRNLLKRHDVNVPKDVLDEITDVPKNGSE